jgi:hypothetical protein
MNQGSAPVPGQLRAPAPKQIIRALHLYKPREANASKQVAPHRIIGEKNNSRLTEHAIVESQIFTRGQAVTLARQA